jgi:hypothetical protein
MNEKWRKVLATAGIGATVISASVIAAAPAQATPGECASYAAGSGDIAYNTALKICTAFAKGSISENQCREDLRQAGTPWNFVILACDLADNP